MTIRIHTADFRKTSSEIAGEDLTDWFKSVVDSTEDLAFDDIVTLGVEIPGVTPVQESETPGEIADNGGETGTPDQEKNSAAEQGTPAESSKAEPQPILPKQLAVKSPATENSSGQTAWLGLGTTTQEGKWVVSRVTANSPATAAGLNTDDELIAINGFRISGSLDSRLKQFAVGDEIEVLIARRGELLTLPVVIGSEPGKSWKLRPISKPTDEQKAQLKSWLGKPDVAEPKK